MRRTLATPLAALAVVLCAAAGCGGGTEQPDQSPQPAPSATSAPAQALPPVTFRVTKKAEKGSLRYEVAIDSQGQWRTTGDMTRSGTLTPEQTRDLAEAVNSESFVEEMTAKRDFGAPQCAAVLPDYFWVLETRGAKATNSCPPKRPTVNQVVALIRQYSGA